MRKCNRLLGSSLPLLIIVLIAFMPQNNAKELPVSDYTEINNPLNTDEKPIDTIETTTTPNIKQQKEAVSNYTTTHKQYTQKEIDMITAVVMQEVGYCSRDSMIAVTNVILNRVKDGRFGETIYDVLHAKNQFNSIKNYYNKQLPPTQSCKSAVIAALNGEDNSSGALYYYAPKYVKSESTIRWFNSKQFLFELDGQNFYK